MAKSGFDDDHGAMDWVVHAGEELAPLRPGGGSGVLIIDTAHPRILHRDHASGRPHEALQSIDRLVDDGRSLVGPGARPDLDARSAIALRRDGTILQPRRLGRPLDEHVLVRDAREQLAELLGQASQVA